jgi:predicted transcriptional regulator
MTYDTTYQQFLEAAKKRRKRAIELKKQGKKPAEIAKELGVTRQRVEQMVAGQ